MGDAVQWLRHQSSGVLRAPPVWTPFLSPVPSIPFSTFSIIRPETEWISKNVGIGGKTKAWPWGVSLTSCEEENHSRRQRGVRRWQKEQWHGQGMEHQLHCFQLRTSPSGAANCGWLWASQSAWLQGREVTDWCEFRQKCHSKESCCDSAPRPAPTGFTFHVKTIFAACESRSSFLSCCRTHATPCRSLSVWMCSVVYFPSYQGGNAA